MKVRELRELLKSSTAGNTLGEDAEVFFYNPYELEGPPHYPIQKVEFCSGPDGKLCCFLLDTEE